MTRITRLSVPIPIQRVVEEVKSGGEKRSQQEGIPWTREVQQRQETERGQLEREEPIKERQRTVRDEEGRPEEIPLVNKKPCLRPKEAFNNDKKNVIRNVRFNVNVI